MKKWILLHNLCEIVETMLLIISNNAETLVVQRIYFEIVKVPIIFVLLLNIYFLTKYIFLLIMFFTMKIHEYNKLLFNPIIKKFLSSVNKHMRYHKRTIKSNICCYIDHFFSNTIEKIDLSTKTNWYQILLTLRKLQIFFSLN